jgi:hypothetical protein
MSIQLPNSKNGLPAWVGALHYNGIRCSKLTLDAELLVCSEYLAAGL